MPLTAAVSELCIIESQAILGQPSKFRHLGFHKGLAVFG